MGILPPLEAANAMANVYVEWKSAQPEEARRFCHGVMEDSSIPLGGPAFAKDSAWRTISCGRTRYADKHQHGATTRTIEDRGSRG